MDYGMIISAAWRITRRYPSLWLMGLFAGSATGSLSLNFNSSGSGGATSADFGNEAQRTSFARFAELLDQIPPLLQEILPILLVVLAILFVVYVAFWLLSIACKGALIAGGGEADAERPVSLGWAWSLGTRAFGRLFLLDLALHVLGLVVFGVLLFSAYVRLRELRSFDFGDILSAVAPLLGVFLLVGIVGSIVSVIVGYAQRAIVLDQAGTADGVVAGLALARRRIGTSLVLWLLGIVLSVGGAFALFVGLVIVLIPAAIVAGILGFLLSLLVESALGFVLLIVLVPVAIGALLVGGAALNTFLWHYWTIAYLRMSRPPVVAAASVSDIPP